jgi:hypothetical protein
VEQLGQIVQMLQELNKQMAPRVETEVRPTPPSPFDFTALATMRKQTAEEYENQFWEILRTSAEARKDAVDRWDRARKAWANEYDFSYKSPNQAKAYVPRLTRNIEIVSQYLRRAFSENQQSFTVEAVSPTIENLKWASALQKMCFYLLDANNLLEKWQKLVKMGLLYGLMIAKITVQPEKVTHVAKGEDGKWKTVERNAYRLSVDIVSPYDIYLDPSGRNRFLIHKITVDEAYLYDLADMGVIDKSAIEELKERGKKVEEETESQKVKHPSFRRIVHLFEYWGDWWDDEGKVMHRNVWMIFGSVGTAIGEKGVPQVFKEGVPAVLLKGPLPNPYWHQKPPFIVAPLIYSPYTEVYPLSLTDPLVDMQREYTRLFNAMLDGAIFDAIAVFEVSDYGVEDVEGIENLWAGKILRKKNINQGQVITPVHLGKMPTAAAFLVQLMERYLLEGFGVTETVMGYLATRGRPTATEVVTARAHAFASIEELAKAAEASFWEPLLNLLLQISLQVLPDIADEQMLQALGEDKEVLNQILSLSAEEREAIARGGYRFKARALSQAVAKVQEIAKMTEFLQLISEIPQLAMLLNWNGILRKMIEGYGWAPDEVTIELTPELEKLMKQAQVVMLIRTIQAQLMGAAPSPEGGAPGVSPEEVAEGGQAVTAPELAEIGRPHPAQFAEEEGE